MHILHERHMCAGAAVEKGSGRKKQAGGHALAKGALGLENERGTEDPDRVMVALGIGARDHETDVLALETGVRALAMEGHEIEGHAHVTAAQDLVIESGDLAP